jgi:hypothetical protein
LQPRHERFLKALGGRMHARGLLHDQLHGGERVLDPVVELPDQQSLPLFRLLAVGDVIRDAAQACRATGAVDARGTAEDAPSELAVRSPDADLGIECLPDRQRPLGHAP